MRSFRVFHHICPHLHIILENVFRTPMKKRTKKELCEKWGLLKSESYSFTSTAAECSCCLKSLKASKSPARRTFWTIFYRWETCLIFCKPFKKANGLLLFLDPFPTRPLLLFPLHATFPPSDLLKQMISHSNNITLCSSKWYQWYLSDLLKQMISHSNDITLCSTKLYQWYLSSSKWYQIGPQLFFHHYTSHQYK